MTVRKHELIERLQREFDICDKHIVPIFLSTSLEG